MLLLLQMGPYKVLTTFPLQIQSSWQLLRLELPLCRITVTSSSDSSDMYICTMQSSPASANAALLPHPRLQTTYSPSAHYIFSPSYPTTVPCSWLFFCTSFLHSPLTLSGFFNGMLEVFEPGALNYSTFFRPILSILSVFRNPILTPLPLSGFLDSLLCVLIVPTPGLAFSLLIPRMLAAALSFSSGRAFFYELSTSTLSSLDSYYDYVGINISPNNSSSVSFLNVYAPLFAPPQRTAEPIPSLPPFFPPPEISSFWGTSIAITPFETQKVLPTLRGRRYSTGSSPQTSSPSMTLTHPLFSIPLLAVAPLLPSSLLLLLLLFLAPGRCCRTLVLTTCQFFYLSPSLRSFAPTSVPLPSIFRKLAGMALPLTLTLTVLQQRNIRLFLFPLLLLSLPFWH